MAQKYCQSNREQSVFFIIFGSLLSMVAYPAYCFYKMKISRRINSWFLNIYIPFDISWAYILENQRSCAWKVKYSMKRKALTRGQQLKKHKIEKIQIYLLAAEDCRK